MEIFKKERRYKIYLYKRNRWACFWQDLARITASDKVLRDKAFNIAKNLQYDGYQRGISSIVYKFFDKKSKGGSGVNKEIKQNQQLTEELHNPIIKRFLKRRVLISKFNKGTIIMCHWYF